MVSNVQPSAPEPFDLPAAVQQALVAWRDAYQGRVDISPHVKSQADCLLKILAQQGLLILALPSAEQLADPSLVPLSAQYWRNAALETANPAEKTFYYGEAFNHVVCHLYAQQEIIQHLRHRLLEINQL